MKTPNNTQLLRSDGATRIRLMTIISAAIMLVGEPRGTLHAETANWTGTESSGNWFASSNWSTNTIPTSANLVVLNSMSGPMLVTGTAHSGAITLGGGSNVSGALYLGGDSVLISTGLAVTGSGADSKGFVTVSGSALWQIKRGLIMGYLGGTGQLDITDDAHVTTGTTVRIGRASSGRGTINLSGNARFEGARSIVVGDGALSTGNNVVGILTLRDSSCASALSSLNIGRSVGATGIVEVYDTATLFVKRRAIVGNQGVGTLALSGSSQVIVAAIPDDENPEDGYPENGYFILSSTATATSSVIVRDHASLVVERDGNIIIGRSGKGVITLENEGHIMAGGITIAQNAKASGTLFITGTKAGTISGTNGIDAITITGGTGSAKIVFNHTDSAYAFANNLAGTLSLEHLGAGYTELSGTNNYSGGTMVVGGTLAGDSSSLQGKIINNATVEFKQAAGLTGAYSGVMSGNGILSKTGAGTLEITGNFTAFDGTIMISEGTLRLDNTIAVDMKHLLLTGGVYDGNWTASGVERSLAGTGTITGNVSLENAILGVGGDLYSTGILTVAGDLAMDNATLTFGCAGGGQSDSIYLLGSLSLSGTNTIDVNLRNAGLNTYNLGNIVTLIDARLTINGVEANSPSGNARQTASLSANGSDLILTLSTDISRVLSWTGDTSASWNATGVNWNGSAATTQFLPGDTVVFDSAADAANPARRTITIDLGPHNISDMLVSGDANYTFTGPGSISALADHAVIDSADPNSLTSASGKLYKSGAGRLVFENTGGNNFAAGIEISGGAVVFSRADQLGTRNEMGDSGIHFTASGTLISSADDITLTNKIRIDPDASMTLDTQSFAITYAGTFDETSDGTFIKHGDGWLSVTGTITAANIELAQGELYLAANGRLNASSSVLIGENAFLLGDGAITTANVTNYGNIKVGKAGGATTHGVMTINGNYSGNGGKLWLDITVNADGTKLVYDKLIITGDASGTTPVSFQIEPNPNPLPSDVTLPAISLIIEVGGIMADDAFTQDGIVEFGGLQYIWNAPLGKWLVDTSSSAKALVCVDAAAILIGKASFDSLQRRLMFTRARQGSGPRKMELWLGGMSRHEKLRGNLYKDAVANTHGVQVGVDWINITSAKGFVFGFHCDHAKALMDLAEKEATTNTESTGFGLYASWTRGALYVDAMVRRAREHYDITPRRGSGFLTSGVSWTQAMAAGITLKPGQSWRLDPQVQVTYQIHSLYKAVDASKRTFTIDSANSLDGRVSVRLWRDFISGNGMRIFTPYTRASWSYEFQGESGVTVFEATFRNSMKGAIGIFEMGAELRMSQKLSINMSTSLFAGSTTRGYSIGVGTRYSW